MADLYMRARTLRENPPAPRFPMAHFASMILVLVLIVGMFIQLREIAHRPPKAAPPPVGATGTSPDPGGETTGTSPDPVSPVQPDGAPGDADGRPVTPLADALKSEVDGTRDEQDYAYNVVLHHVVRSTDEELSAAVEPNWTLATCLARPRESRGRVVRFRAYVHDIVPVRIATNPSGVDVIYRLVLSDVTKQDDPWRMAFVHAAEKPPPVESRNHDIFEIDGVFVKSIRYEAMSGAERDAAFLLARSVRAVPRPPPISNFPLEMAVLGFVAVSLGLLVLVLKLSGKQESLVEYQARLRGMRKDRPAAAPGSGTAPTPNVEG